MGGLLNALNAGRTSLSTNQKAIEIAGNNIANVNTPGYSRQQAELSPFPSLQFGNFFIGQGVKITDVTREHDVFITRQLQDKAADYGEESAKADPMSEIERVISVADDSLATDIDKFFDAWQELSANPSGQSEREIVLQRGSLLAESFHGIVSEMETVQGNINSTLLSKIDNVNYQLGQVAELNQQIAAIQASGQSPNTFLDQRDQLLQQLSQTLGIQSYEDSTGMVGVQLPGGLPLVQSDGALSIEAVTVGNDLQLKIHMGDATFDINDKNLGGEFRGLIDTRDNFIPSMLDNIDQLAYSITNEVNNVHQGGTGLDGVGGRDFFSALGAVPGSARNMSLALTASNQVAAGTSSASGDNTNALAMAGLADAKLVNGEDTFVGFYGKVASQVGVAAGQNQLALTGADDAMLQLENLREGKVGVSIEEEMIDLMQYQKGFEASAKYLSTVDEMMDTILSLKR